MAGALRGDATKPADLLFDLNVDDDVQLSKSELLQLVNYGQLQKTVKIPGTDGKMYEVELAILWDEDHIDVLRKTTSYAGDPLLRVRIMRRLKIHKAIQRIDALDFSDKEDPMKQRLLWSVLNRLSEQQMEYLNTLYEQISMERDMQTFQALKQMSQELSDTAPKDIKPKENKAVVNSISEHADYIKEQTKGQEEDAVTITKVLGDAIGVDTTDTVAVPSSPIQNPNETLGE